MYYVYLVIVIIFPYFFLSVKKRSVPAVQFNYSKYAMSDEPSLTSELPSHPATSSVSTTVTTEKAVIATATFRY
jgi:hypothetical protein